VEASAVPPFDTLNHLSNVPTAERLATVGLVLLQNVCGELAVGGDGQHVVIALNVKLGSPKQAGLVQEPDSPSANVFTVIFRLWPSTHVLDTVSVIQKFQEHDPPL
jgi:hypothetical protein